MTSHCSVGDRLVSRYDQIECGKASFDCWAKSCQWRDMGHFAGASQEGLAEQVTFELDLEGWTEVCQVMRWSLYTGPGSWWDPIHVNIQFQSRKCSWKRTPVSSAQGTLIEYLVYIRHSSRLFSPMCQAHLVKTDNYTRAWCEPCSELLFIALVLQMEQGCLF